jgi:hypothetical protein
MARKQTEAKKMCEGRSLKMLGNAAVWIGMSELGGTDGAGGRRRCRGGGWAEKKVREGEDAAEHTSLTSSPEAVGELKERLIVRRSEKMLPGAACRLQCVCDHGIICEVRQEWERLGFLMFFYDQEDSETYSEQVVCCPRCGAQLDYHQLSQAISVRPG